MKRKGTFREVSSTRHTAVSLFTGAGGLDLGLEAAGFSLRLCVENDSDCRETLRVNRPKWRLAEPGDIHRLKPRDLRSQAQVAKKEVALLAAGPPCQPFSKSGFWRNGDSSRLADPRAETLQKTMDVIASLLPKVVLIENVQGLGYRDKDEGLALIHRGFEEVNAAHRVRYYPQTLSLNAAHFGVPQMRERLFILANRGGARLELPQATHGAANGAPLPRGIQPYRTAWDAIGDLDGLQTPPELAPTGKWAKLLPSIPEGWNYLWHTPRAGGEPLFGWRTRYWSFLLKLSKDQPSWTIQAKPGPSTGPFHWRNRKLTVRELCRLQTIPDDYEIRGGITSRQRQVGNAVPPAIGELLGLEIRRQFFGVAARRHLRLIPTRRADCPDPERRRKVPKEFLHLRKNHKDHPGTGKGPGAKRR